MLAGYFHQGSGLGNQLHRFVGTRVMALDNNHEHGMVAPELFKGKDFMTLPIVDADLAYEVKLPSGEVVVEDRKDVLLVDGEFQWEGAFDYRLDEVREWLKVEPLDLPDDLCVINFRGGEYVGVRDLFLPQEYWDRAMEMMREKYPDIKFQVHTDDPITARQFFPDLEIISDIALNWRSIRYAKHLILSNSSFAILPALLGEAKEIIAPKHHANYNKGTFWQTRENIYRKFTYLDNKGMRWNYDNCIAELGVI